MQFVFQNNEKWRSYEGLNGHGWSKNSEKVENLMSHFWETTVGLKVKFLRVIYVTGFEKILRMGSARDSRNARF